MKRRNVHVGAVRFVLNLCNSPTLGTPMLADSAEGAIRKAKVKGNLISAADCTVWPLIQSTLQTIIVVAATMLPHTRSRQFAIELILCTYLFMREWFEARLCRYGCVKRSKVRDEN